MMHQKVRELLDKGEYPLASLDTHKEGCEPNECYCDAEFFAGFWRTQYVTAMSFLKLMLGETETFKKALVEIKKEQGKVCPEFEICKHESCQSSYSSYAIADEALRGVDYDQ